MARSGARDSFARAEEDLLEYTGIQVDAKDLERVAEAIGADIVRREQTRQAEVMTGDVPPPERPIPFFYVACDGTGVPVTKRETVGLKGKQSENAKTREAKLGCIFTQTKTTSEEFPLGSSTKRDARSGPTGLTKERPHPSCFPKQRTNENPRRRKSSTSKPIRKECAMPASGPGAFLWDRVSSKPVARPLSPHA
jgi:hypothetical protein